MNRRNRLWLGGAAALSAGVLVAGPLRAAAQEDDGDWVGTTLDGLVADGTLTQAQADAVDEALDAARPVREHRAGPGRGIFGRGRLGLHLETAAETIGIEVDALRDALRDGQTIAEVATANGVDPQDVVDAMVAAVQERIDTAVDNADERLAEATERITDLVNEGFPARGEGRDERPATTDEDTEEPATTTAPPTTVAD